MSSPKMLKCLWSEKEKEIISGLCASMLIAAKNAPELAGLSPEAKYAITGVLVSTAHEYLFGKDSKPEPRPVLRMVPRTATR